MKKNIFFLLYNDYTYDNLEYTFISLNLLFQYICFCLFFHNIQTLNNMLE